MSDNLLPEQKARIRIDKQLNNVGWDIVARDEYISRRTSAVKEALMKGNTESDYLLFIDDKAIAVLEAKKEDNDLGNEVAAQAEGYAVHPQSWYGCWKDGLIPLVYMANGKKIYFKNMLDAESDYVELSEMHTPKKMLQIIGEKSEYGALPLLEKRGLRDCQYEAAIRFEDSLKLGQKKNLAVLATGSGKTYLACLSSYRLLNYTPTKRVLFLVDRNNLAKQTESEFSLFDRTEKRQQLSSLYQIKRLRKADDINGDVVISTIQKLYAVLTGNDIIDDDDAEDENNQKIYEKEEEEAAIVLEDNLTIPPDYFQLIIIDECHRSIYGKWKAVLDYFKGANVLGLTATPTPEAYAFFNNNIVKNYTYDESVVDGVNVPSRVYRIKTKITEEGGNINAGAKIKEKDRKTGGTNVIDIEQALVYDPEALDRSVINPDQIKEALEAYRDSIYTDLYPNREDKWEYIPKTLIFAKDDYHATQIVRIVGEVFKEKFDNETVPEKFVQKITYTAGDSNALIRDFRTEKEFRVAVTVTLVATGTDIRPLEVVFFMKDVHSEVLYTQMRGRGCRVINDDKLKEITPNAETKECFYIVDAVGVTESDKVIPGPVDKKKKKTLTLEQLLERLSHNEVSDDNLGLLRDYCSTINRRYEDHPLFGRHLQFFINEYGFAPRTLANSINMALSNGMLVEYFSPSDANTERRALIYCLMSSIPARNKLLEMQKGYYVVLDDDPDELLYAGFSKESAKEYIDSFEKYINDNKDSIEALRILYNTEEVVITHSMLSELRDKLIMENRLFTPYQIWHNYKIIDDNGSVDELNVKNNVNALTNLIQLVRYGYKKNDRLRSLIAGFGQRFSLYCGQEQRTLTEDQTEIMRQVGEYIVNDGAISLAELNDIDTDLWRRGVTNFTAPVFSDELEKLTKFILRVA